MRVWLSMLPASSLPACRAPASAVGTVEECRPVPKREVLEFLVDWVWSPYERDEWSATSSDWRERHYERTVDEALGLLADTGLYVVDETSLRLTPLGDVFVTAWLSYLEGRDLG